MVVEELLSFDEFRRRVGASEQRTRAALFALDMRALRLAGDARKSGYPAIWVEQVKKWIEDRTQHVER